jgi:hypothetical protein
MKKYRWNWNVFLYVFVLGIFLVNFREIAAFIMGIGAMFGTVKSQMRNRQPLSDDASMAKQLRETINGTIAIEVPNPMVVGKTKSVTVELAKELTEEEKKALAGRNPTVVANLKVGTFMTVELKGGDAFEIESVTKSEQPVFAKGWTEWSWNVTPQKRGKHPITVVVTIRFSLPERQESLTLKVYEKEITVHSDTAEVVKEGGKFVLEHAFGHVVEVFTAALLVAISEYLKVHYHFQLPISHHGD